MSDGALTRVFFGGRKWKEFTVLAKENAVELLWKMDKAKKFNDKKCLQQALTRWGHWVGMYKKSRAGRPQRLAGPLQASCDSVLWPEKARRVVVRSLQISMP